MPAEAKANTRERLALGVAAVNNQLHVYFGISGNISFHHDPTVVACGARAAVNSIPPAACHPRSVRESSWSEAASLALSASRTALKRARRSVLYAAIRSASSLLSSLACSQRSVGFCSSSRIRASSWGPGMGQVKRDAQGGAEAARAREGRRTMATGLLASSSACAFPGGCSPSAATDICGSAGSRGRKRSDSSAQG